MCHSYVPGGEYGQWERWRCAQMGSLRTGKAEARLGKKLEWKSKDGVIYTSTQVRVRVEKWRWSTSRLTMSILISTIKRDMDGGYLAGDGDRSCQPLVLRHATCGPLTSGSFGSSSSPPGPCSGRLDVYFSFSRLLRGKSHALAGGIICGLW